MANPATDRQRMLLIGIAVVSMVMAVLALQVIKGAGVVTARPLPAADVQNLTAFLGPLPDSTRLAEVEPGTMVVDRDPFGFVAAVTRGPVRGVGTSAPRPTSGVGQRWVVSSILFEESRRSAIVNNAWVGVGDPLGGGARVTAIERKHVIVTDANGIRHVVPIQGGAL